MTHTKQNTEENLTCVMCAFFIPDKNSCSPRGYCCGLPVATVDQDGYEIKQPSYPRRDSSDNSCALFRMSKS